MGIDFFHFARVKVVGAAQDACRVGDNRVQVGGAEIDGGKAFHDFVGQADGGIDGNLQGRFVRDSCSVRVAQLYFPLFGKIADLFACAVD